MKRRLALITLAALCFCVEARPSLPEPKASLGTVGQFKSAFQNDRGKVRLVALVSPT